MHEETCVAAGLLVVSRPRAERIRMVGYSALVTVHVGARDTRPLALKDGARQVDHGLKVRFVDFVLAADVVVRELGVVDDECFVARPTESCKKANVLHQVVRTHPEVRVAFNGSIVHVVYNDGGGGWTGPFFVTRWPRAVDENNRVKI